ncbi:MAG: hypothetical protein J6K19_00825 [Prevotella sp.]|nr:hypothetical protein [Prevotella sp.]
MQKRNYVQRTVAEFEAAKPLDMVFLSMSLSGNCVKYVKGYRIMDGKPEPKIILWDSRGRAYTRYISMKNVVVRLRNAIVLHHEGWKYIRDNRFDLFKRNSHDQHHI